VSDERDNAQELDAEAAEDQAGCIHRCPRCKGDGCGRCEEQGWVTAEEKREIEDELTASAGEEG